MIKILILLFSLNLFAAEKVGMIGNSLIASSVVLKIQKNVTLTADDQTVTVEDFGAIGIDSDDATAANRTFVLSAPAASTGLGHVVTLFDVTNATNSLELIHKSAVPGAGEHRMGVGGDWRPTQKFSNITFQWSGSHWIERGDRADIQP